MPFASWTRASAAGASIARAVLPVCGVVLACVACDDDPQSPPDDDGTPHTVTAPMTPAGPSSGDPDTDYEYCTSGGVCSLAHSVAEYQFRGDGGTHAWVAGCDTLNWSAAASASVEARAKCSAGVVSPWSAPKAVTIGTPPPAPLTDPIWEYPRSQGHSITGGYVYRGPSLAALVGKYVYGDHVLRHVWALSYDGTTASNEFLLDHTTGISSFGVAENGELFLCGYSTSAATKLRGFSESGGLYSLTDPFPNLSFDKPVDLQNAGDGSDRLFVVEQNGVIRVFPNDASATGTSEFLNISARPVVCCGEMGLLGLAFHPDYENNGFFFVYYMTDGGTPYRARLSRFQVSGADPNDADETSERILLEFNDRETNHNGGAICFDDEGYLHLAVGDEGSGGDPYGNAQNRAVLFGKILRLDVDQSVNTPPYYGIPADNPFVGNTSGYREEIFAWGLRNPWRMSYDAVTDRIWVGDVGQTSYEEIDIIESGKNYGWDCREGAHDYTGPPGGPSPSCPSAVRAER
jgi:hypothetical protein